MYKLGLLALCIFGRLSASATVSSVNIARSISNQSLSLSNSSAISNVTGKGPFNINCLKSDRRGSAKFKSCENAAALLPSERQRTDFINRRYGTAENAVPLPMNFVSGRILDISCSDANLIVPILDDATCILTVSLRESEREGRTDYYILRESAYAVLRDCVKDLGVGGIATDFTSNGHFAVRMEPYANSISCDRQTKPPLASCEQIAATMPISSDLEPFGPTGDTRPSVGLPYTMISLDRKCAVTINGNGVETIARWIDIWTAVTAVNGKCVRAAGKGGRASNLGDTKKLSVTIADGLELELPGGTTGSGTQATA
ncbi:MAG: hypothetical protein Q9191_005198 [Dirinaria sp. TL-2023a]